MSDAISRHRLRREIIATSVANSLVNRAGCGFVSGMVEESGAKPDEVARAYAAARHIFQFRHIWRGIEALDNKVASNVQLEMFIDVGRLIGHATLWLLRNRARPLDISAAISAYLLLFLLCPSAMRYVLLPARIPPLFVLAGLD